MCIVRLVIRWPDFFSEGIVGVVINVMSTLQELGALEHPLGKFRAV